MNPQKKIVFNSLALYVNMGVTMLVTLLATRYVLQALGEEEYGVYILVANIVALFSFLNVSMAAATQRFLSFAMGEEDKEKLSATFQASMVIHLAIAVALGILLLGGGSLLICRVLDIPGFLMGDALCVLMFMTGGLLTIVFSAPYEGALNAHEDIFVIAGVNIIEAVLKLCVVFVLFFLDNHRIAFYALLIFSVQCGSYMLKRIYCRRHYEEVHYSLSIPVQRPLLREMGGYAGWNLIGVGCSIARLQGSAILLNVFFGILVNAAYGVAQQVNGFLIFFANSIVRPLRPHIVKLEGAGEHERMISLSFTTCRVTFLMLAAVVIPLYVCMPFLLDIWLDEVPEGTLLFCRAFLIIVLIDQFTMGLQIALESVGRIRRLQTIAGSMQIASLPVAFVLFLLGFPPITIMFTIMGEQCVTLLLRTFIARKDAGCSAREFLVHLVVPCVGVAVLSFAVVNMIAMQFANPWVLLVVSTVSAVVVLGMLSYLFCLSAEEKAEIFKIARAVRKKAK